MTDRLLNKVSIRIESGGHSFSAEAVRVDDNAHVEAVVSTPKTALVPAELFAAADAEAHLAAVGVVPEADEQVVCSGVVDGTVAVMAIASECAETLRLRYGSRLSFLSPLQEEETIAKGSHIRLDGDVLYVRVYNDGMRLAEALEVASDADVLYYLESIHRVYDIYNMYARAWGDVERLKRVAGRCFKNLVTA